MSLVDSHPILSCEEARRFEQTLFAGDEAREWPAMQRAGRAIAQAVARDYQEIGAFPRNARLLVLVGKGHNGGDAFIAAHALLETFPHARADILFAFGPRTLRPLAARAWQELAHAAGARVTIVSAPTPSGYTLALDGVFGFQFRPPADARITALFETVNALPISLRAAVDLPSADLFRADFTYATGIVKKPALDSAVAGRLRYLDLDFFAPSPTAPSSTDYISTRVLTRALLAPLAGLRPSRSDKRTFGHVFLVGGSRQFPGAILMSTLAALRSGAGLVTAFVPESLVPTFAARAPEAMWVGWPETPSGHLALEGEHLLRERLDRASALVLGPGLGREPETLALAESIVRQSPVPLVIDADALQATIVRSGPAPRILTPHAGELARLGAKDHTAFAAEANATLILKGPRTQIADRTHHYFVPAGGPVLARGGSGDLLAGLSGGLLAQHHAAGTAEATLLAAAQGAFWHGLAADALARAHGHTAISITQLLDFLPIALRESADEQ